MLHDERDLAFEIFDVRSLNLFALLQAVAITGGVGGDRVLIL